MDIRELLRTDLMIMDLKARTKAEVIDEMVHNLFEKGVIKDEEAYKKDIIKREEEGSTGMGDGIAIPHAHNEAVNEPAVMFAKSEAGVDYDSLDGQPAHLFFMIAAPEGGDNTHLQALRVSGAVSQPHSAFTAKGCLLETNLKRGLGIAAPSRHILKACAGVLKARRTMLRALPGKSGTEEIPEKITETAGAEAATLERTIFKTAAGKVVTVERIGTVSGIAVTPRTSAAAKGTARTVSAGLLLISSRIAVFVKCRKAVLIV